MENINQPASRPEEQPPQQEPQTSLPQSRGSAVEHPSESLGGVRQKKSKLPIIIAAVVVIIVVGAALAFFVFMSNPLVGKWNLEYTESSGGGLPSAMRTNGSGEWIEFHSDGTGTYYDGTNTSSFQWEDRGGGKLAITDNSMTLVMDYKIEGNKLTLTFTMAGMTSTSVYTKA